MDDGAAGAAEAHESQIKTTGISIGKKVEDEPSNTCLWIICLSRAVALFQWITENVQQ